jgi:hypothetical protein
MRKRRRKFTHSRTSPKDDRRGCLCPDGRTYSRDCCDGSLQAQGIGSVGGTYFLLTEVGSQQFIVQEDEFSKIIL